MKLSRARKVKLRLNGMTEIGLYTEHTLGTDAGERSGLTKSIMMTRRIIGPDATTLLITLLI